MQRQVFFLSFQNNISAARQAPLTAHFLGMQCSRRQSRLLAPLYLTFRSQEVSPTSTKGARWLRPIWQVLEQDGYIRISLHLLPSGLHYTPDCDSQLPTLPPGLKALHNLNNHFSATSKGRECSPCESEGMHQQVFPTKMQLLAVGKCLSDKTRAHTHTQNFPHSPRNALQNASKGTHNTKIYP